MKLGVVIWAAATSLGLTIAFIPMLFTFKPSFDGMLIGGQPLIDGQVVVRKSDLEGQGGNVGWGLVERDIEICSDWILTVSEQRPKIDSYLERQTKVDPFGKVLWPGAISGCRVVRSMNLEEGTRVCVVGCGVGLEVLALLSLGLEPIGVDYNAELFELPMYDGVETKCMDLTSEENLPASEAFMACDCLYSEATASALAIRFGKLIHEGKRVIVTDSQRFHSKLFLEVLNTQLEKFGLDGCLKWREIELKGVSTRGVTDGEVRVSDVVVNLLTA
ncbi:hypothetical protein TrVE_jg6104 [Triparma verrucosa]|uniref:Uncharacterized protein n=1 Tax=Triparma verrucosa TaxID=1606542 RepID=A0A9W7BR87_9STRA|nr:hypothetical protein TrVE_jg6104 [Triparma verrucosa]